MLGIGNLSLYNFLRKIKQSKRAHQGELWRFEKIIAYILTIGLIYLLYILIGVCVSDYIAVTLHVA